MCCLGLIYNVVRNTPYRYSKMGQMQKAFSLQFGISKAQMCTYAQKPPDFIPCSHVIRIGRNGLISCPRKTDPNSMILFPEEKHVEVGTCENSSLNRHWETQEIPRSSMTNAEIPTWSPLSFLSAETSRKGHHELAHFCYQKSWCSHLLYPQKRQMHLLSWHRFALWCQVP